MAARSSSLLAGVGVTTAASARASVPDAIALCRTGRGAADTDELRMAPVSTTPSASENSERKARFIAKSHSCPTSEGESRREQPALVTAVLQAGTYERNDSIRANRRSGASQNGMCPAAGTTS